MLDLAETPIEELIERWRVSASARWDEIVGHEALKQERDGPVENGYRTGRIRQPTDLVSPSEHGASKLVLPLGALGP